MTVTLDVVLFSYLDRPIFDAFISGKVGDSSGVYPQTGGSTISGVQLKLGPQKITWRLGGPEGMERNGEVVTAKNQPELKDLAPNAKYLAIHIYPDDTVELFTSPYYPRPSPRGELEIIKMRKKMANNLIKGAVSANRDVANSKSNMVQNWHNKIV